MEKDVGAIIDALKKMHGKPRVELLFSNPLELTVATILSAQCTDDRVNKVTALLFRKYKTLDDYIGVPPEVFEEDIRPTGFYRNKAKSIKSVASEVKERFGGTIPDDVDIFATVKGIGRKSANMIVGLAYGKPAMIVDTHMARVSQRLGLTDKDDPDRIEEDLKRLVPEELWMDFSLLVILHGRYRCKARKPDCPACLLRDNCDYLLGQE